MKYNRLIALVWSPYVAFWWNLWICSFEDLRHALPLFWRSCERRCCFNTGMVIIYFILNRTVTGNRELLEAEVDGNPKPFVEWYLNGKLVAESRTLRTYFDGRVAFLKIYEACEEHQGQYLCRASNKLGTVETRCTVIVQRKYLTIKWI